MKVRIIEANGVKEFNKGIDLEEFMQTLDYSTNTEGTAGNFNTYADSGTSKMDYTYSSLIVTENPFFTHIYSTS